MPDRSFRAISTSGAELCAGRQRPDGTVTVTRVLGQELVDDARNDARDFPDMDALDVVLATMATAPPSIAWDP